MQRRTFLELSTPSTLSLITNKIHKPTEEKNQVQDYGFKRTLNQDLYPKYRSASIVLVPVRKIWTCQL